MKLFTNEQMTGSGQTNMLDLIQANEDRIEELKNTPHIFWHDPGHGWLEVRHTDLIVLDIEGLISGYSYRNGDKVYLEEDSDAGKYIDALFGNYGERTPQQQLDFESWRDNYLREQHQENIFIRKLRHFR